MPKYNNKNGIKPYTNYKIPKIIDKCQWKPCVAIQESMCSMCIFRFLSQLQNFYLFMANKQIMKELR